MKATILSLTLSTMIGLSIAASSISIANASGPEHGSNHQRMMFSGLGLSAEQKQDIREILRQSKQDNSVYKGEKKSLRAQMKSLMQMSVWDEALATDLATQKVTLGGPIELNRAKAQNAAFAVLTAEQQSEFLAKQAKRAERDVRFKPLDFERLQDRLALSDEQVESLTQIQNSHEQSTAAATEAVKAHKEAERALIVAATFDESAWTALQAQIQPTLISLDVAKSESRFEMKQLLNEEQQAKLTRIMKKQLQKGKGNKAKQGSATS